MREIVPEEVMDVPVEDARRFLPFYIQDALKRAVGENDESVKSAIASALENLSGDMGASLVKVASTFEVEVEPPAIPLYSGKSRAPLSQGAAFLMGAGSAIMLLDALVGSLLLLTSILGREVGRHLEAADKRAALSAGAQALVQGSVESMEAAVTRQFQELEGSITASVREAFAPRLQESAERLAAVELGREQAVEAHDGAAGLRQIVSPHLAAARHLLADLQTPAQPNEPPSTLASRRSGTEKSEKSEEAEQSDAPSEPQTGSATGSPVGPPAGSPAGEEAAG
jgi:hypothetical protein